jgi:hypothetical protein
MTSCRQVSQRQIKASECSSKLIPSSEFLPVPTDGRAKPRAARLETDVYLSGGDTWLRQSRAGVVAPLRAVCLGEDEGTGLVLRLVAWASLNSPSE